MKETGPESAIEVERSRFEVSNDRDLGSKVSGLAKQSSSSDFNSEIVSTQISTYHTHHVLCITVIVKVTQKHVRVRSAQHTEI